MSVIPDRYRTQSLYPKSYWFPFSVHKNFSEITLNSDST